VRPLSCACCLLWGLTYVQAASTFWWKWYLWKYLCQVNLLTRCSTRYSTPFAWGSCTLSMWTEEHISLRVVKVTSVDLEALAFILHLLSQHWIIRRLVCSSCEAMAGSLSMTITEVSSAKVAVVESGEVVRSEVYKRYRSGPRTLPWGVPAFTRESSMYSFSTLTRKYLLCR
jgi:hypothetical protein